MFNTKGPADKMIAVGAVIASIGVTWAFLSALTKGNGLSSFFVANHAG